jgi:hypothetical protein
MQWTLLSTCLMDGNLALYFLVGCTLLFQGLTIYDHNKTKKHFLRYGTVTSNLLHFCSSLPSHGLVIDVTLPPIMELDDSKPLVSNQKVSTVG